MTFIYEKRESMITMYIRYSKDVENREKIDFLIFLTKEKDCNFLLNMRFI